MKSHSFLLLILLIPFHSFSQDDFEWKEPSKESQAYHKYRTHLSYPPYGLEKVNALIRKQVVNDQNDNLVMKPEAYSALSLREKFTYNMLHAEEYSQNCDAMPPVDSEQVKIFAYLPDAFLNLPGVSAR